MRRSRFILLGLLVLGFGVGTACLGQTGDEMFKNVESEQDYEDLLGVLDAALKEPINLAEADRETIGALPWVGPWLAARIVDLREAGGLHSLDDLTRIDGVSRDLIDLISPFVVVRPVRKAVRPTGTARLRFVTDPADASFESSKTYFTLRTGYSGFGFGFTVDKDRHETQMNDFQSVYAEKSWPSVYIVAGNFMLNSGYGLVFSRPYGHSPSTVGPWRFSRRVFGLKPYTSTIENFMLGGAACALRARDLEVCIAVSSTEMDARLNDDGLVEAISMTGTHVSESEREGKDALREDLAGLALRYSHGRLSAGAGMLLSRFDRDFEPGVFPWLDGNRNNLFSADATYLGDEFAVFGEAGFSGTGGTAFIGGLAFERPAVDLLALGRKYARAYLSLHSRPFSAYSRATSGEEGLFLRLALKPMRRSAIVISNDIHRKDLGHGKGMSPTGSETMFEAGIGLGEFDVEISLKMTDREDPPLGADDPTTAHSRYRTRLDLEYRPHRILRLRLRLEDLRSREEMESVTEKYASDLMRLDVELRAVSWGTVKTGFYAFKVEDYSSRLYQYEPGLPYYPSLEMLKSDGSRWYLIAVLRLGRAGAVTLKFGATSYDNAEKREDLRFDYGLRF